MKIILKSIGRALFFATIVALLLTACGKAPQNDFSRWGFADGIYATRPQDAQSVIITMRLKSPALLEQPKMVNGKATVDPDLLNSIQSEQAAAIASLKKISPGIQILFQFKLILNAITVVSPPDVLNQVTSLPNITLAERSANFARPMLQTSAPVTPVGENTSVKFIGAETAYAQNLHGEGMRIGVIDTGIDYTHKMFGGEGTAQAYQAIDPSKTNPGFPTKKVVGGLDIVGTNFDSGSANFSQHIPVPDLNPLDEAGHGSHVSGTIAGIGDGINTYSGVAPAASLYAIKVFGKSGDTSDEAVLAALEFAANPSGDPTALNPLDVVNMSLGGDYGSPHILYTVAIQNLIHGGTVVVASAGNSGNHPYVVGSPSTVPEAISVAASIDNMTQNVQFPSAEFSFAAGGSLNTEAIEGSITVPLESLTSLTGTLVDVGLADQDFPQALKDQVKGKIALAQRGSVAFADKIQRAQDAGAIAIIVVDSEQEDPIAMGGTDGQSFNIPGVMISMSAGAMIAQKMKIGAVTADLKSKVNIQKPWLVDTITDFSSRGPRSQDGLLKPEVAAPGSNIISAAFGQGDKGTLMSGTSMASPHITGSIALLKQKFKTLTPLELKSVLMSHSKILTDPTSKQLYPVTLQGAGRVQLEDSLNAKLISQPQGVSFGITDLEVQKVLSQNLTLKNIGTATLHLTSSWNGSKALKFNLPEITLTPGQAKTVNVTTTLSAVQMAGANDELGGFLSFSNDKDVVLQVPVLVIARQISQISAKSLVVKSTSAAGASGSVAEVAIANQSVNPGPAYLFNMLGVSPRESDPNPTDVTHDHSCQIQSAGYRILQKNGVQVIQFAVKLYEGLTTWNSCEVNIQVDGTGNNVADQELAGIPAYSLPGMTAPPDVAGNPFMSLLLNADAARGLRHQFELAIAAGTPGAVEDYTSAVIDQRGMQTFDNSTLAIVEADLSKLALAPTGELNVKISTNNYQEGAVETDDYLANEQSQWQKLSISPSAQAFDQIPETISLKGNDSTSVSLIKGYGTQSLILYAPQNQSVNDVLLQDTQSQIIPMSFKAN